MLVAATCSTPTCCRTRRPRPRPAPGDRRAARSRALAARCSGAGDRGAVPQPHPPRSPTGTRRGDEFHPALRSSDAGGARSTRRPSIPRCGSTCWPRCRKSKLDGGSRNMFQFGAAAAAEPQPKPKSATRAEDSRGRAVTDRRRTPPKPPETQAGPAAASAASRLKYYGFSTAKQRRQEDGVLPGRRRILVAPEGETVKKRYKVVRIGVNSVMMEDTESKSQQSLPLAEEAARRMTRRAPAERARLRAAAGLPDGGGDRDHPVHGDPARGVRIAAAEGTAADRARRAVQARHPALRQEEQALSGRASRNWRASTTSASCASATRTR